MRKLSVLKFRPISGMTTRMIAVAGVWMTGAVCVSLAGVRLTPLDTGTNPNPNPGPEPMCVMSSCSYDSTVPAYFWSDGGVTTCELRCGYGILNNECIDVSLTYCMLFKCKQPKGGYYYKEVGPQTLAFCSNGPYGNSQLHPCNTGSCEP